MAENKEKEEIIRTIVCLLPSQAEGCQRGVGKGRCHLWKVKSDQVIGCRPALAGELCHKLFAGKIRRNNRAAT